MRKKTKIILITVLLIIMVLSCNPGSERTDTLVETYKLNKHNNSLFEIADGWSNGDMFNATWRQEQVTFSQEEGVMTLTLQKDSAPLDNIPYKSGEYRTREFYHYGK